MTYAGNERRVHRVYVTRNTEYHTKGGICVAVKDRESGKWIRNHAAVQRAIAGSIRVTGDGLIPSREAPDVGDSICFSGEAMVTSRVTQIERPEKEIVMSYRDMSSQVIQIRPNA